MRIATYNIHRSIGADGQDNPERTLSVIKRLDADVIALQEVGSGKAETGEMLQFLGDKSGMQVIEGITLKDHRGDYGNAVLTRLPVANIQRHDISVPGREPRGAIELLLQHHGGTDFQIVATHLGLLSGERRYQIKKIIPLFENRKASVKILLGDLNEWFPWSRPLRWLRHSFGHHHAPATFPVHRPRFALDRIWVKPQTIIDKVYANKSDMTLLASDHLPLVADLNIQSVSSQ